MWAGKRPFTSMDPDVVFKVCSLGGAVRTVWTMVGLAPEGCVATSPCPLFIIAVQHNL